MALPFHREAVAPVVPAQPAALVEFRAGRMIFDGRKVEPDTRRGLVRIIRTDDGLLHFQWSDRITGAVEEDQIVFPEEAVFEKVSQSSGRVYLLKFKHDDRKLFFWMQESQQGQDSSLCEAVNRELNNVEWIDGNVDADDQDYDEEMLEPMLRDEEAVSLSETTNPPDSNTEAAADATNSGAAPQTMPVREDAQATGSFWPPAAGRGQVQLSDLQNILSGLGQLAVPAGYTTAADIGPSLTEVLKPEFVLPLLQNVGVQERLAPYLPEGLRTSEAMRDLIQSPQFHQQLEVFSHLLQSGQVDWSQFGIDSSNYGLGVTAFLSAVEDLVQASSTAEESAAAEASAKTSGPATNPDAGNAEESSAPGSKAGQPGQRREPDGDDGKGLNSSEKKSEGNSHAMDEGH